MLVWCRLVSLHTLKHQRSFCINGTYEDACMDIEQIRPLGVSWHFVSIGGREAQRKHGLAEQLFDAASLGCGNQPMQKSTSTSCSCFYEHRMDLRVSWGTKPAPEALLKVMVTSTPPNLCFWTVLQILDMGRSGCWGVLVLGLSWRLIRPDLDKRTF